MAVGELVVQEFTVDTSQFRQDWQKVFDSLDALWGVTGEAARQFEGLAGSLKGRWKRPYSGPAKLCIDGHQYHRRQRNRVKRRK